MNAAARVIAFYLPQFHPIPENDSWWGKGFTEWTNVAKAKPLYPGHYQPHVPADLGFYDLRCPETRFAQAHMARQYGIEGFCYYHYWFGGRRILERPFAEVLASGEPDFPFCLCWANHSWSGIWSGNPNKALIEQVYPGQADHETHFRWLLNAFSDPRYIQVDGKPLFLIYKPDDVPELPRVIDQWRRLALTAGLKGLHLVGVAHRSETWDPRTAGLDAATMQSLPRPEARIPRRYWRLKLRVALANDNPRLTIWDYRSFMPSLLRGSTPEFLDYPIALPNWDNTPRSGLNGVVLHGSHPQLFRMHFREAVRRVSNLAPQNRIVFLKAWNEWAEGNYVEPDLKYGHGFLEVIRDELLTGAPRMPVRVAALPADMA